MSGRLNDKDNSVNKTTAKHKTDNFQTIGKTPNHDCTAKTPPSQLLQQYCLQFDASITLGVLALLVLQNINAGNI